MFVEPSSLRGVGVEVVDCGEIELEGCRVSTSKRKLGGGGDEALSDGCERGFIVCGNDLVDRSWKVVAEWMGFAGLSVGDVEVADSGWGVLLGLR